MTQAIEREVWEQVDRDEDGGSVMLTQKMRVDGGYIYRTVVYVGSESIGSGLVGSAAVSMVFVPWV